jgi:pantoate--beta-alanine ligase
MEVIESLSDMQERALQLRREGRRLVLVPTMGALHAGHLSLLDDARQRGDCLVVSIFVNPTQFGPNEDYLSYPRQRTEDLAACQQRGADIVFLPSAEQMYPDGHSTSVLEGALGKGMEGVSRPGHFQGVTTVVMMLFQICLPEVAVFGQKDAQQLAIIRKMTTDLHLPVSVVGVPTLREPDGLAMSSRNAYLEPHERAVAPKFHEALSQGKKLVEAGTTSVERVKAEVMHQLSHTRLIRAIYVDIVDPLTMSPERVVRPGHSLLCGAVWLNRTRLIDNLSL